MNNSKQQEKYTVPLENNQLVLILNSEILLPEDAPVRVTSAQLEELDRPTLHRLVKRIEVGEKYQVDRETHRDIKIYYNFVRHIEL